MQKHKFLNILFAFVLLVPLVLGGKIPAQAMPMDPTDEIESSALLWPVSQLGQQPVNTTGCHCHHYRQWHRRDRDSYGRRERGHHCHHRDRSGSGYSSAKVDITGSGTGATADAIIVKKGSVVSVTVNSPGTGYTAPTVTFSGRWRRGDCLRRRRSRFPRQRRQRLYHADGGI